MIGETVTLGDRGAIQAALRIPLITQFTSTEGPVAQSDRSGEVVRFAGDACMMELVARTTSRSQKASPRPRTRHQAPQPHVFRCEEIDANPIVIRTVMVRTPASLLDRSSSISRKSGRPRL